MLVGFGHVRETRDLTYTNGHENWDRKNYFACGTGRQMTRTVPVGAGAAHVAHSCAAIWHGGPQVTNGNPCNKKLIWRSP